MRNDTSENVDQNQCLLSIYSPTKKFTYKDIYFCTYFVYIILITILCGCSCCSYFIDEETETQIEVIPPQVIDFLG